jgi:hypothetical protein
MMTSAAATVLTTTTIISSNRIRHQTCGGFNDSRRFFAATNMRKCDFALILPAISILPRLATPEGYVPSPALLKQNSQYRPRVAANIAVRAL